MSRVLVGIVRFVGLLSAGIFTGFLVAVLVFELSLRRFDGLVYAQVRQVELVRLDDLAAATLIPATITAIVLAVAGARTRGRALWLPLTAAVLLAGIFVLTLTVNLPINSDQLGWDVKAPPADWASVRDRWQLAHAVRTCAAVLAFGCLIAAGQATGSSPDRTGRSGSLRVRISRSATSRSLML
jgi:uncharacterized membrane protein